jgi:hypothetical protein
MASTYVVEKVVSRGRIFVLVPYGYQPDTGGVDFSGTSEIGEFSLGLAEISKTRCLIRTLDFNGVQPLIGIVRWGFIGEPIEGSNDFIEKGWDYLKAGGKMIDFADLPTGRQLEVRVRWKRAGVDWTCQYF